MEKWYEKKDCKELYRTEREEVTPALNGTEKQRIINICGSCYIRYRTLKNKSGWSRWTYQDDTILETITKTIPGSFIARSF